MRTRVWCTSLVLASLAVACGDQPTEVVPEREMTRGSGMIADATSSSDDGLSITTDQDDYAPRDTVWFTGTGWPASDVLDIVLTDDPTHDQHEWTVQVGADGTFRDSTYVVDVADIGVTFTLTATSRGTGRSLSVQFTDAPREYRITIAPATAQPNASLTSFTLTIQNVSSTGSVRQLGSANISIPTGFTAVSLETLTTPAGKTWTQNLNGSTIELRASTDASRLNPPSGPTAGQSVTLALTATTPLNSGGYTWSATVKEGRTFPLTGPESQVFDLIDAPATVTIPGPTKLAFVTATFTRAIGECSPEIRAQSQNAADAPTNPSTSITVNLSSSSSGGTFYSDPTCSAGNVITSRTIPTTGNVPSFYYKDSQAGSPTLTAADAAATNPLTSATQVETISPPPGPNKLAFITSVFTRAVGQCSPEVKVQSQNGSNAPVNPTAPVTVNLTTSSTGGAFYSDAACSAANVITSRVIPTSGNIASFYYRDVKAGSPTLTAADPAATNPLASDTQQETIDKATPSFSNLSSPTITYGDTPTTLSGKISSGSLFPTGNVSITLNGVTKAAAIGADGSFSESFTTGALGVAGSPYAITYSYLGDDDFNPVSPNGGGILTVEKATPAFSALSSPTITYGDTPTSLSGKISKGSLVPTGNVSITVDGLTKQASIQVNGAFSSGFVTNGLGVANSPYAITYSYGGDANFNAVSPDGGGNLTVNPAPLTITAEDQEKDYDGQPFTGFTVEYLGFVNSEAPGVLGSTLGFSGTAVGAVNAGSYTIIPEGLTSTNYDITFEDGTLTINKVQLTVMAVNRAKVWDGQPYPFNADPVTTTDVTYSGFVNGEGPSVLTGLLAFSAGTQIATGTHTNTPSGLGATNYSFAYVAGTLTIHSWTLTGFYQPVDMSTGAMMWNTVKGGSTVPLKFNVYQATSVDVTKERTDVAAIQQPFTVTPVTCAQGSADQVEFTTTGGTTLRYSLDDRQFIQNWQTPKSPGACYRVTMTTIDGSKLQAHFKLK
jgi:hypothetical protein